MRAVRVISTKGRGSENRAQRGLHKNDRGPILSNFQFGGFANKNTAHDRSVETVRMASPNRVKTDEKA